MKLVPGKVTLSELRTVWEGASAMLDPSATAAIQEAHMAVMRMAKGTAPIYGVNTGFGKLASIRIAPEDSLALQRNLILSHACGLGDALDIPTARLMMALKLVSLGRGASGVSLETVHMIEAMIERDVTPIVPQQGSVGASGDLAPLAHMAAVMIGEAEAQVAGRAMSGGEALALVGLEPIVPGPKEGLALINGTQFSTACALAGLFRAWDNLRACIAVSALSTDAIMGSTDPLDPEIHQLRRHPGQIEVAEAMRRIMEGSEIRESHREGDTRVQDPYCIRCQPQVTGAALDLLRMAGETLNVEANAVTDNPLVLSGGDRIVSGGNFHAEPVAFAADMMAIALAEIGTVAQRRIALMVDPTLSFDLPPFLTPAPGLNSGLMVAEIASAALMSENRHLANPCSTDSTPTSASQEDHVSMSAHGACRLKPMNDNLGAIIGIEAICAAQGVDFRAPLRTSVPLLGLMARLRSYVPVIGEDRYLAPDISAAAECVASGMLCDGLELPELESST